MNTKPILFSTDMVRAIIDGRKTQTRRIIKWRGEPIEFKYKGLDYRYNGTDYDNNIGDASPYSHSIEVIDNDRYTEDYRYLPDAKLAVGDILWVRETRAPLGDYPKCNYTFMYRADVPQEYSKWKPGIHMPKEACRLFLKVTDVRAERLRDISEPDAIAEGCISTAVVDPDGSDYTGSYASEEFKHLWNSINSSPDKNWDANPWVWVVEFEITDKPEGWPCV